MKYNNAKILWWWRNPESNWGHKDFQSSALPTELFRQITKRGVMINLEQVVNYETFLLEESSFQRNNQRLDLAGVREL